ncbi:Clavaminate synthase-like protein [Lophium mytilinum]|uniref:Clavaminate synthase-like protein n=1 Tax=Lophium mytilinum TaxID=390894 RepID=A0A6A6QPJ9_9PEZI|nr:Clavaminate synthase-like protein [Lophium mytilinum]
METIGLRAQFLQGEAGSAKSLRQFAPTMTLDSKVKALVQPGPDIEWDPSVSTYEKRVATLAKQGLPRANEVPAGFPAKVDAPWVWSGADLDESKYIVKLDGTEIAEVEKALEHFKNLPGKLGVGDVSQETFPLPTLRPMLEGIAKTLHLGIGFSVIRGLDPKRYTPFENAVIYLGITAYIGEKRGVQDAGGSMMIHVKDLGSQIPNSELRQAPYARNPQPFHNDVCDILAMYVQQQAASGGESMLASCAKIYNEIAENRPDVIHTLADPSWIFDKHTTPAFWNKRALLFNFAGHGPGFCFSRRPITGSPTSPRSAGVPAMTEVQAEAIDMVHFTAAKHQVSMRLQPGDIQLINNLACQHARAGFTDSASEQRHIIRLWLRNENLAWKTPDGLKATWAEKYGDASEWRKVAKWSVEPGASRERVICRKHSCS